MLEREGIALVDRAPEQPVDETFERRQLVEPVERPGALVPVALDVATHASSPRGPNGNVASSRASRPGTRSRKAFCIAMNSRPRAVGAPSAKRSGSGSNS